MKDSTNMGFDFNPSLWFLCRLCRRSFVDIDTFKKHKLSYHLGECMGIKSIVFEERLLTEEWEPEDNFCNDRNPSLDANANCGNDNKASLDENGKNATIEYGPLREFNSFQNPYVTLTRLTVEEISSYENSNSSRPRSNCRRKKSCREKGPSVSSSPFFDSNATNGEESELSKEELRVVDESDDDDSDSSSDFRDHQTSSLKEDLQSQEEIQLDEELPSYDALNTTTTNSVADGDQDLINQEFIVASVAPNNDGVPQVRFASTLVPASAQEYQLLQQQYLTISETDPYPDTSLAESEHEEMLSDNEATDFNENLANVEIKIDTYDSDLLDNTLAVQAQVQEPELEIIESIEHTQSASVINCQSTAKSVAKPFMCETCFAFFRTKSTLNQHMVSHSSLKPFECSMCPSRFKRKNELDRHQIVHGKETNFKCRFCNKCFSHNQNLLEHERGHTGDKAFKCPVATCDYAAYSKGHLTVHTRRKHSEELGLQQFICPKCGNAYGVRHQLKTHILNHDKN